MNFKKAFLLLLIVMQLACFASSKDIEQKYASLNSEMSKYTELNNIREVENYLMRLKKIDADSEACNETAEANVKKIYSVIKRPDSFLNGQFKLETKDMESLHNKITPYVNDAIKCLMVRISVESDISSIKNHLQSISKENYLKPKFNIIELIQGYSKIFEEMKSISLEKIYNSSRVNEISAIEYLGLFLSLVFIYLLAKLNLSSKLWQALKSTYRGLQDLSFSKYLFAISTLTILSLFIHLHETHTLTKTLSDHLYNLIVIILFMGAMKLFVLNKKEKLLNNTLISQTDFISFMRLITIIGTVLISYVTINAAINPIPGIQTFRATFDIVTQTILIGLFATILSSKTIKVLEFFGTLVKLVIYGALALTLFLSLSGYYLLTKFFLFNLIMTSLILAGGYFITLASLDLLERYVFSDLPCSKKTHEIFGLHISKNIPEIIIISFILFVYLLFSITIFFLNIWQFPSTIIDNILSVFFNGTLIVGVHINPFRILQALLCYSVIMLLGRFISGQLIKKSRVIKTQSSQVTVASLIIYITFTLSVITGLIVSGVNMTGVAIVAGALSVGVGIGLQDIVKNFVSGIILLLEQPIRPGDRVIVDGHEGFVKKIRIRATQILTLSKEDIIVPNSLLISSSVTNLMYRDKLGRITCSVGVAYGSDTEMVIKLLYQVAQDQPEILNEEPNTTTVLFRSFGDNSLNFELWCITSDVNRKYVITSDMYFQIDQLFRKHNITIAFPQRDLHIKDATPLMVINTDT